MPSGRAQRRLPWLAVAGGLWLGLAPAVGAAGPEDAAEAPGEAFVRLRDHLVYAVRVPSGGQSAEQRARTATTALATALEAPGPPTVRLEESDGRITLFAGAVPVIQLGLADAAAAGDASLRVHAAAAAAAVEHALQAEKRRMAAQSLVLAVSLVVFVGLICFLIIRKLGDLEGGIERWLEARPQGTPAVRLGNVELASERAVRGGLHVFLRFAKRVLQALVAYLWLLFALSRFDVTSDAGARITRMMLEPLGRLIARVVGAVPQLLALAVLAVVVFLVLRSVQLFFGSVARGETHLAWIPAELARPTGTLLQGALLLAAVMLAGPVTSGDESGPFQALSRALLIGLAIACAPLFAAVIAGLPVVYGRTLRPGEVVDVGGQVGTVKEIDLLSVVLEDARGRSVRVPHLVSLFRSTRVLGPARLVTVEVAVDGAADQAKVKSLLLEASGSHASGARVELRALDARAAVYRVTSGHDDVGVRVAGALNDAGVRLAALARTEDPR
ncbi:MAG TPA: mechanosensitive ion channel domain-containing protein [Myxococcaceae bacterium]|nr:mechanosensitive ion channel domain-containing protein [Myxococcaceae bacterium]